MGEPFREVCAFKPENNGARFNRYFWGYIIPRKDNGGLKTWDTYAVKWGTELFGTALFTILGGASGNALQVIKDSAGNITVAPGAGLNGAFNNAISLAVCIYITAAFSGGKLNPAVSFALALGAVQTIWEAAIEIAMQFLGGIIGANIVKGMLMEPKDQCFAVSHGVSPGMALMWETLITFVLCMTVFATAVEGTSSKFQSIAPLAIGLSLFAGAQAAGTYTGASANPARYVGPLTAGVGCSHANAAQYIGGEFLGATLAAVMYITRFMISQTYCEAVDELDDEAEAYKNREYTKIIKLSKDYNKRILDKTSKSWNEANPGEFKQAKPAAQYRSGFMATDL